jgi:hypothetical protein
MGRFETLNADTKDLVNCLLPALAASFKVSDAVEIIPEDIRMRAWDCERRDHIKDQTENDPRNWGVQFLKDLMAISRLKSGDLDAFQADLRAKVALHEPKHPWCRLGDIKELKDEYENPNRPQIVTEESSGTSSTDSYLEELHEPDLPRGMKRGRKRNHEVYEARIQESHKRRKCKFGGLNLPNTIANLSKMDPMAVSVAPKRAASTARTKPKGRAVTLLSALHQTVLVPLSTVTTGSSSLMVMIPTTPVAA